MGVELEYTLYHIRRVNTWFRMIGTSARSWVQVWVLAFEGKFDFLPRVGRMRSISPSRKGVRYPSAAVMHVRLMERKFQDTKLTVGGMLGAFCDGQMRPGP
jgi:hypothetical protein